MIKQTIKTEKTADGIDFVMNGVMFSQMSIEKENGSPAVRLSMTDDAAAMFTKALQTGEAVWTKPKPAQVVETKVEGAVTKKPTKTKRAGKAHSSKASKETTI